MRRAATRLAAALVALGVVLCAQDAAALVGEVTHLSGAAIARHTDGQSRILSLRSEVREGDLIATAENTYVRLKFADGGDFVLRPNSQLKIDAYSYSEQRPESDNIAFALIKGGMRSVTGLLAKRNPANFRLATPTATVGIRGTHFGALVCNNDCSGIHAVGGGTPANGLHVDVSDGVIVVTSKGGAAEFRAGQFGYVASQIALPVIVPPNQGTRIDPPPLMLNQNQQGGGSVGKSGDSECTVR